MRVRRAGRGARQDVISRCVLSMRNSPYKAARSLQLGDEVDKVDGKPIDWSTHTLHDTLRPQEAVRVLPANHQRATMSAESTKEATAEGHKVTSVETPSARSRSK